MLEQKADASEQKAGASEQPQKAAASEQRAQQANNALHGSPAKPDGRGMVIVLPGSVLFRSNGADLLPAALKRLDEVATVLVAQEQIVVVEGHTDSKGSPWKNVDLSRRRAEAVRRYLVSRGCPTDRIVARGMGSDRPVADNASGEGRANNRRIEIVINGPDRALRVDRKHHSRPLEGGKRKGHHATIRYQRSCTIFDTPDVGGHRPRGGHGSGSDNVAAVSGQPMGRVAVRRGVQGPGGLFTARLLLLVNASKDNFGKPTSLAPDLFYSVSDTVQIGLLHTGPMGWQSRPGFGLCLTGTSDGCPKVYNNVGFDFMYGLLYGDFHLSLHSSLFLLPIPDPTGVMWTIGLTGKFHFTDVVALFFDPQVGVMLSHRDLYKEQLFIPVELQFQATAAVSLKVLSGVSGQLSDAG